MGMLNDGWTFIERGQQRVNCSKLSIGDRMEIVSDSSTSHHQVAAQRG